MPTWENPEIYQIETVNQANQDDWPKETWKKCPIKVIQTAMRLQLGDSVPESTRVSIHTVLFFLLHFVRILFCKAEGQGLVTDHWSSG